MKAKEAIKICEEAHKKNERANLRGADLRDADLRDANLRDANLWGATGKNFYIGYFGQHFCVAAGDYIVIGCERHTIKYWLENYQAIGKNNSYSEKEIAMYGAWIKIVSDAIIAPTR